MMKNLYDPKDSTDARLRFEIAFRNLQMFAHGYSGGSTSEPLMFISFHLLKNNDPKNSKNFMDIKNGSYCL